MKNRFILTLVLYANIAYSQNINYYFNEDYIKEQINFSLSDANKLTKALLTLKNFTLSSNPDTFLLTNNPKYAKEFKNLYFCFRDGGLDKDHYYYNPMTFNIIDDSLVSFQLFIVQSFINEDYNEAILYSSCRVFINHINGKVICTPCNLSYFSNIKNVKYRNIELIGKGRPLRKKDARKAFNYIKYIQKVYQIEKNNLDSKVVIVGSENRGDGFFYYGFDYHFLSQGQVRSDGIIFVNMFPFLYKHELVHKTFSVFIGKNMIINEGIATWHDGSNALIKYDDERRLFGKKFDSDSLTLVINNFLNDTLVNNYWKYDYIIRAVYVSSLLGGNPMKPELKVAKIILEVNELVSIPEITKMVGFNVEEIKTRMYAEFKRK